MRQKHVTQKDILLISISMFIVVVLWIGFNLYHAWATSTINEDLKMKIVPIEPSFDIKTIEKLKTREKKEPFSELNTVTVASPAAEEIIPISTPQPEADQPLAETEAPLPTEQPGLTEEEILLEESPTP